MKDHWNSRVLTATHALSNLLLLLFLVFISQWFTPTAPTVIITVFMIVWYLPVSDYNRREKKPLAFTPRIQRLMVPLVLIIAFLPYVGVRTSFFLTNMLPDVYIMAFGWVLAIMLVPFYVMFSGLVMKPVERSIQQGFIRAAQKKLASMPGLKIIGITGSYGKTSTKFALATMLSERYSVCFTPGSFNTPMGICKVINNDLQSHHQILILEMGARYRGNIAELCGIAHPNIAVLTNIGKAHLETFGSQEVIAQTKGELLEALNPGETAVVNADDALVMSRAALRNDISVLSAGLHGGDFRASDIRYDARGCSFTVTDPQGEQVRVETRLLGHHNVHNVLMGFAVGSVLGLRLPTLALAASRIEPVEHRLELKSAGDYTIIDDAFNSNPVGARNAIDVLASFEGGRRIVVTPGMVELGDSEVEENRSFGEHIGRSGIEQVVLVGKDRAKPIYEGLKEAGFPEQNIYVASGLFDANDWLRGFIAPGDVVLYENDLPDSYEG